MKSKCHKHNGTETLMIYANVALLNAILFHRQPNKIFITEEKMAARMNGMHISNNFVTHSNDSFSEVEVSKFYIYLIYDYKNDQTNTFVFLFRLVN